MIVNEIKNKIVAGDILEKLSEIPDETFDMVFADPPFNLKKNMEIIKTAKMLGIILVGAISG